MPTFRKSLFEVDKEKRMKHFKTILWDIDGTLINFHAAEEVCIRGGLKKYGVDTVAVKQLFKNDINTYVQKAEVVKNAEIFDDEIAISKCETELLNTSLVVAQAADDLLNIKGIKASFVLSPNDTRIVISGRSLGDINVQMILEKLGGGGSMTIAGAQVPNVTLDEAMEQLKAAIKEYKDNLTSED